jgi:hypothetical protein
MYNLYSQKSKILKFHFQTEPHVLNFFESENKYIQKMSDKNEIYF